MGTQFKISKREMGLVTIMTVLLFILDLGLFFDQIPMIPVEGASTKDWNPDSFWHEPWGSSGVHKGIDIFARKGTAALATVSGMVVFRGELKLGGNVLMILEPKWRLHYYAHLDTMTVGIGDWVPKGSVVGIVGNTGNARGKQVHLHYEVISLIPSPSRYSTRTQGWKRMFYLDPDHYLRHL